MHHFYSHTLSFSTLLRKLLICGATTGGFRTSYLAFNISYITLPNLEILAFNQVSFVGKNVFHCLPSLHTLRLHHCQWVLDALENITTITSTIVPSLVKLEIFQTHPHHLPETLLNHDAWNKIELLYLFGDWEARWYFRMAEKCSPKNLNQSTIGGGFLTLNAPADFGIPISTNLGFPSLVLLFLGGAVKH